MVVTVRVHSLLLLLISTEEGVHLLLLLLLCLVSQFLLLLLLIVVLMVVVLEDVTQLTGQHLIAAATNTTAHLILTVAHCFGEKLLRLFLQLRKAVVV